jgi:hypothetical protein
MSLGAEQRVFTQQIAKLILWAYKHGYEISFGDAYRDPRVHGDFGEKASYSARDSFHKKRLAIDLNLFVNGEYLQSSESHRQLGEYWKSLDPKNTWGGDFSRPDGNHYSRGERRG